ncbi:hypothetical protein GGQ68_004720 [Sagittula marina]|uniref:Uncharacterized protein n=1 Tax=Sagittula marina TaxID=943940 RepID=A0A7W6DY85_9RHOB|nr:hypothetical protein [Sagittula marina]MBB3988363.1 hypothetical protein [Sagittula marina]
MVPLKTALCALALCHAIPAQAAPVDEHVQRILALSEAACRVEEGEYRDLYHGDNRTVQKTLSFVAEGTRLLCESIRLDAELARLRSEEERLRAEAERLENAWQTAHRINPAKFPNFKGRDTSQKRLLSDAEQIGRTLLVLSNVQNDLRSEARRILSLASEEFNRLSDQNSELLLASLDDEDSHDVIIRLLKRRG